MRFALDRLGHFSRRVRLTWLLPFALLCLGLVEGASIDRTPAPGCLGADANATASIAMPVQATGLDLSSAGSSAASEVSDAQDDPAPSLHPALDLAGHRKPFETLPAIAFTSAHLSRHERPPIRSSVQS